MTSPAFSPDDLRLVDHILAARGMAPLAQRPAPLAALTARLILEEVVASELAFDRDGPHAPTLRTLHALLAEP